VEDDVPEGTDRTEPPVSADGIPALPPEISSRQQELRDLVDAGAASPEELRELAAKLREQRSYERSLWQREVRPALMQAKKKRFSLVDLRRERAEDESSSVALGVALVVGVLVLIFIAANTSFLILVVAALGVLVYAWVHGRQPHEPAAPEVPPADTAD
jgi:Flp pilus assembly protein TadB